MKPSLRFLEELVERAGAHEIIDAHQHLGSWGPQRGDWSPLDAIDEDVTARLAVLDKSGVDQCSLMAATQRPAGIVAASRANDAVVAEKARSERFRYAVCTLTFDSEQTAVTELGRCASLGFDGLMLHHRYEGKYLDHPLMWPILGSAQDLHLPVFLHLVPESSSEALWRLERVARAFPTLQFVALDALSTPASFSWVMHAAADMPNVAFDTALLLPALDAIRAFCARVGAERLVYGSDLLVTPPSEHFPWPLFEILASPITEDDRGLVLASNIRRIFGGSAG
jgi:predicted TIM-barrel fold metal-dependent hydrolase